MANKNKSRERQQKTPTTSARRSTGHIATGAMTDPLDGLEGNERIVREAQLRFDRCQAWESTARQRGDSDERFAAGDSDNGYQWDAQLIGARNTPWKPSLTINKVRQHNLQIINDAKQNKPGVNIRPTGGGATYKAAQTFQAVVRHIEYDSGAEQAYDSAFEQMVNRGIGYWRIMPVYVDDESFDQKVTIKRIPNPNSVYLDPDINDVDGLDARFGFIFTDMAKDRYRLEYPDHLDVANQAPLNNVTARYSWIMRDHVRVAEYYRKQPKQDTLHLIRSADGEERTVYASKVPADLLKEALAAMEARNERLYKRKITRYDIEWIIIAGDTVISKTLSPGKYVPIIRCCAEETVIQGVMDRKGHTRALKDPQRMYNYNASAFVEHGALQNKVPYIAAAESIAGYETIWNTANIDNFSFLPFKSMSPDGKFQYPPPQRQPPPQAAEAFVRGMLTAREEMMMASGQYEANFGQKSNEQSGVAINARQRKGENATYHYIDAQSTAIRATGKVLLDMIPIVYDTERVLRIKADDGTERDIKIDPEAQMPYAEEEKMKDEQAAAVIFNPKMGEYAVVSDPGPSYATRRQEAFNALIQIIGQDQSLMQVVGDLFFRTSDFPLADEMADRFKRVIPAHILGQGESPETMQMKQMIEQLSQVNAKLMEDMAKGELDAKRKEADASIGEYDAITRRLSAMKEIIASEQDTREEQEQLVRQLVVEALTYVFQPQEQQRMAA